MGKIIARISEIVTIPPYSDQNSEIESVSYATHLEKERALKPNSRTT